MRGALTPIGSDPYLISVRDFLNRREAMLAVLLGEEEIDPSG